MKSFGKSLQVLGLMILPAAMMLELSGALGRRGVSEMVIMLVFGLAAFCAGRVVEGYASN